MRPKLSYSPGPHESIAPNSPAKFEREHAFRSVFRFWSIYSPMGSKIEKRFEKHVPVWVWRRSLKQSIREGRGVRHFWKHNYKNFRKLFVRSLTSVHLSDTFWTKTRFMVKFPWCLNQSTQNGSRLSQILFSDWDEKNNLKVIRRKSLIINVSLTSQNLTKRTINIRH